MPCRDRLPCVDPRADIFARVKRKLLCALVAGLGLLAQTASARHETDSDAATANDGEHAAADAGKHADAEPDFGHGQTFGIFAGLVGGYSMTFRYDRSPLCGGYDPAKGGDQLKSCGHAAPLALDLGLSFAPVDFIEPYLWARLGLSGESQTDTKAVQIYGAGLRFYTLSDARLKVFVQPAIAYEVEGGAGNPAWQFNNPDYKKDLIFQFAVGPQFDFAHNIGVYASGGITMGILRAIHSTLDAELGVQLRVP
jgi:opacity protein-like surface antigen